MKKHMRTIVWSITGLISGIIIGFTTALFTIVEDLLQTIDTFMML